MEAEIQISRRFKLALNETELREMIRWYEELDDEKDGSLGESLYVQLKALRDGVPLNVESPPSTSDRVTSAVDALAEDPMNFARLRQSTGNPTVGGEWIERS